MGRSPRHPSYARILRSSRGLAAALCGTGIAVGQVALTTPPARAEGGPVPTVVTAVASTAQVVVGRAATVSGVVTPPGLAPRIVVLQLSTAAGWQDVADGQASSSGDYEMSVPTDWYDRHVLRVVAPATALESEGVSDSVVVVVAPRYEPRGKPTSFKRFTPLARWDPCRSVPYRTNLRLAPKNVAKLVKQAFKQVHAATGLRFHRLGSTTKVPFSAGSPTLDYGIIVAWTTPRRVPALRGVIEGMGGATAHRVGDGPWQYVAGGVAVDAREPPPVAGFGAGQSLGALLLHEIGHAMGLAHVGSTTQIMNPVMQDSFRGRYEAGDLAGLHLLGAAQGCFG